MRDDDDISAEDQHADDDNSNEDDDDDDDLLMSKTSREPMWTLSVHRVVILAVFPRSSFYLGVHMRAFKYRDQAHEVEKNEVETICQADQGAVVVIVAFEWPTKGFNGRVREREFNG